MPAPGKLLGLKGQVWEVAWPASGSSGHTPRAQSGAEHKAGTPRDSRAVCEHTGLVAHLQLVLEPAAGAQVGEAPACWLRGDGCCAAGLTCLGHAGPGSTLSTTITESSQSYELCYPNDDRET